MEITRKKALRHIENNVHGKILRLREAFDKKLETSFERRSGKLLLLIKILKTNVKKSSELKRAVQLRVVSRR